MSSLQSPPDAGPAVNQATVFRIGNVLGEDWCRGGRLPTANSLHQSFVKILSKHLAANKKVSLAFQQKSSMMPIMNPSPADIVELFTFVEVTFAQHGTVTGHLPCPIRMGSPKLLPYCLCKTWCHVACSYQTHLGRVPVSHRDSPLFLTPMWRTMLCFELGRTLVSSAQRVQEVDYKTEHEDASVLRWCTARWTGGKHAWLSTGLIWLPEAPDTGQPPKMDDHSQHEVESMPTISLFEFWEEGVQLGRTRYF